MTRVDDPAVKAQIDECIDLIVDHVLRETCARRGIDLAAVDDIADDDFDLLEALASRGQTDQVFDLLERLAPAVRPS